MLIIAEASVVLELNKIAVNIDHNNNLSVQTLTYGLFGYIWLNFRRHVPFIQLNIKGTEILNTQTNALETPEFTYSNIFQTNKLDDFRSRASSFG